MSISINQEKCLACGKCQKVCPGNLISHDVANKAYLKYPRDCWGCAACLKECPAGAISYFLGADIGGKGAFVYTKAERDVLHWFIVKDGKQQCITINKKESNKY